jgi:hypothetical protein
MYNLRYISDNGKSINFSPIYGWAITDVDGLTAVSVSIATSQGVTQVGSTIQGVTANDKMITVEGQILGLSEQYRKRLIDTIVPTIGGSLMFDSRLEIRVEPENTPNISRDRHGAKFQFSLRAPYPYWREISQTSTTVGGITAMFKFPVNYSTPHQFGMRVSASYANIINSGNVPVPFVIIFFANTSVVNPRLTNIQTLEFIRLNREMSAGETVIIDLTRSPLMIESVINDVTTNIFGSLDIESDVRMTLKQGNNYLRYDADENREGLDCIIRHHNTTAGAYGNDRTYR